MALRLVGDLTLGLSHLAGILGGASAGEAAPVALAVTFFQALK